MPRCLGSTASSNRRVRFRCRPACLCGRRRWRKKEQALRPFRPIVVGLGARIPLLILPQSCCGCGVLGPNTDASTMSNDELVQRVRLQIGRWQRRRWR